MNPVHRSLERVAAYFAERDSRPGLVARRLLHTTRESDEKTALSLIKERRAKQRSDGSVSGELVATSWFVWELLDLGVPAASPPIVRAVKWLTARQDKEGAYVPPHPKRAPADPRLDAMGGFFAYRTTGRKITRLALPNGAAVMGDGASRLLASVFALRSVLRAGRTEDTLVRRHVGSLLALPHLWDTWGGSWSPTLMANALSAMAWSPPPFRNQLPILSEHLALNQKPDGSWRNLDVVNGVEALVDVPLPQAREAVALAAPRLARMQGPNGALGSGATAEERTLIALRAWLIAREYA